MTQEQRPRVPEQNTERSESEKGELAAFKAGFEISGEGYNAEYGGADDEWLAHHFAEWKHGTPLPEGCRARRNDESKSYVTDPPCGRPEGHDGPHSWEAR